MIDPTKIFLSDIRGVGPKLAKFFEKKKVYTICDLLFFSPRRYEDRSTLLSVGEAVKQLKIEPKKIFTFILQCSQVKNLPLKNRRVKKFFFSDVSGELSFIAFNPAMRYFKLGEIYQISGDLKIQYGGVQINIRDWEKFDTDILDSIHSGRIVPIYPSTEGLSQKRIRSMLQNIFKQKQQLELYYSFDISADFSGYYQGNLLDVLERYHFPSSFEELEALRKAIALEEMYRFQVEMLKKNFEEKKKKNSLLKDVNAEAKVVESLPFELTQSQSAVLKEIKRDIFSDYSMNRLLQGDVGSGKTLVSALAAAIVSDSRNQVAVMAPTEILALQLFKVYSQILKCMGFCIDFLSSSIKEKEKKNIIKKLAAGQIDILIGTHSLYQEKIEFLNLRLVVIDEQHRFGVEQRQLLTQKGEAVDLLMMSATPIPQTLSMTYYGNLDISILKDLPAGRLIRKCKLMSEDKRPTVYQFVLARILLGEQAMIVFPVIDKSSQSQLKKLEQEYTFLKKKVFQAIPTAMLHGKLNETEKIDLMDSFNKNEIKVLFATTIVEVGIDNPNVTVMVIESAQQFGLSTLHQLRGRVGRGNRQGYCYLIHGSDSSEEAIKRLESFTLTEDGFEIAEADLFFRGTGEFFGERQSGSHELKIVDLQKDKDIIFKMREFVTGKMIGPSK